ncbi:hypothetical protein IF2G_03602 [Cordyceps javanica]|nr:hypothetical protein IF2G_03602 [Cordyceps javanica]
MNTGTNSNRIMPFAPEWAGPVNGQPYCFGTKCQVEAPKWRRFNQALAAWPSGMSEHAEPVRGWLVSGGIEKTMTFCFGLLADNSTLHPSVSSNVPGAGTL